VRAGSKAAKALLPASLREQVKARLGEDRVERLQAVEKDSFYSSIDWKRTSAYSEPGRHVININLEGGMRTGRSNDPIMARSVRELPTTYMVGLTREALKRWNELHTATKSILAIHERASDLYVYWNSAADLVNRLRM
jgi:hypothetical protein